MSTRSWITWTSPSWVFGRATPADTGRPGYNPATLLKLYIYGYLNRVPSNRRLEREAQRNLEVVWLTGCLAPDFKTIADFRRDNGPAIKATCRQFVLLCRKLDLFTDSLIAVDDSRWQQVQGGELANMAPQAKEIMNSTRLTVVADRGYFSG